MSSINQNISQMDPSIVKTGWGIKQGGNVKSWKKRWFVLLSNGLCRYFIDKLSTEEQGNIEIKKETSVCISPSVADGVPLTIVTKDRIFHIAFQTKEEAETWETTIKQLQTTLPE